jgi:hypothetical protein
VYQEKTNNLQQVSDKHYQIMLYWEHLTIREIWTHNFSGNRQIAQVVVNPTTVRSRPSGVKDHNHNQPMAVQLGSQIGRDILFFLLKCVKIWNKIPYLYGNWNYSEINKIVFEGENLLLYSEAPFWNCKTCLV